MKRIVLLLISLLATSGCAASSEHEFDLSGRGEASPDVAAIEALSRDFSAAYMCGDAGMTRADRHVFLAFRADGANLGNGDF